MNNSSDVLIFTEAGYDVGLGHVSRCLAIYDSLEAIGKSIQLIVNSDDTIIFKIKNRKHLLCNWLNKEEYINIQLDKVETIIIDSYKAELEHYNYFAEKFNRILFFDDKNRLNYPSGFILNPSLASFELDYIHKKGKKYLLGPNYQVFQKAFWGIEEKTIREKIEKILITVGGNDIRNILSRIIKVVSDVYCDAEKYVILPNSFIKEPFEDEKIFFYHSLSDEEMKSLMIKSDIIVTASGQTMIEAARTATPIVAFSVADNQESNVIKMNEEELINYCGSWYDVSIFINLYNELMKINSKELRKKQSDLLLLTYDGKGQFRVIEELYNELL
jgi:UDP-2,4-diacetamido-2,4,6-trideoxy-beta-L-altropyranose hydrolase